jgi:TPR repeat protein
MKRPLTDCSNLTPTIAAFRQNRMSVRLLFTAGALAAGLLISVPLVFGSDDPCYIAYWDSTKTKELRICEAQAESGEAESEFGYGLVIFSGTNRHNDRAEGLEWFRKSARQGHRLARISLGTFLSNQEIEEPLRNIPEAYAWYSIAGATQAASKLKSRMTEREAEQGERLAAEYRTNYGETTGVAK